MFAIIGFKKEVHETSYRDEMNYQNLIYLCESWQFRSFHCSISEKDHQVVPWLTSVVRPLRYTSLWMFSLEDQSHLKERLVWLPKKIAKNESTIWKSCSWLDFIWRKKITYRCNFPINLSSIGAFRIRVFESYQLKQTHPKRVYIDKYIIVLFIEFRRHKFRSS